MSDQTEQVQTAPVSDTRKEVNLLDVEINSENVALNVMVALLNTAQKRGVFTMQESAKAWECVQKFLRPVPAETQSENITMNVTEKAEA
tara:strand:+ start:93 stop:359 length:267 start_codon:yes stop_codon:yes gene_type:complete